MEIITGILALASTVIALWKTHQEILAIQRELTDGALDARLRLELQFREHQHQLRMIELNQRISTQKLGSFQESNYGIRYEDEWEIPMPLFERLRAESILLSERDYKVVYEMWVDEQNILEYLGLALPLPDGSTLAFLISGNYPLEKPQIFVETKGKVDQVKVECWYEDMTLAESNPL